MEEIVDMGLIGMKITPAPDYDMNLDDERIMPIYEKAEELGMIIHVHTGWAGYDLLSRQHPLHLDRVSVRFPDLKLIVVHAGFNYYEEVVMMMLKNRNMYAGTGWWGFLQPLEANVRFLKYAKHFKVLDKCLWGTDNYDCREDVPYIKSFPRLAKELNIAPASPTSPTTTSPPTSAVTQPASSNSTMPNVGLPLTTHRRRSCEATSGPAVSRARRTPTAARLRRRNSGPHEPASASPG